jgi:hypothetical protein
MALSGNTREAERLDCHPQSGNAIKHKRRLLMANPHRNKENVQQDVQQTMDTTRRMTAQAMAALGEQAARTSSDVIRRNVETVQHAWQSGSEVATRLTEHSTEQVARAFGMSGEESQKALQQSTRNLQAIVGSSSVLVEGTLDISREWFDLMRRHAEHNFERIDEMMHCRSPQEMTAIQSEVLRENLEDIMQSTRRTAEISLRIADEAARKTSETAQAARRAA